MNAYGFAQWYARMTPLELRLAKEFQRRWRGLAGHDVRADADFDDVPDQCDFIVKNTATLALQLIKRFRNIRYATYRRRLPPSIMLSYYAGVAAQPNMPLSAMVVRLASWIISEIEQASLYGKKVYVANPVCPDDVFTDRWPDSIAQQNEFAGHLRKLVHALEKMRKGEMLPTDIMDELRENFGERVVTRAADQIAAEVGSGIQQSRQIYSRRGGVLWPTATGAAASPLVNPHLAAAKPHTFFGRKI
jgi:hypothetical protein